MDEAEQAPEVPLPPPNDTIEGLCTRIDMLGAQMTWLCENMQGLFQFINQMGSSGGGIRGLMSALKSGPDLSSNGPVSQDSKVE